MLNATYEPLAVVSIRRAVCLVLAEKVEVVLAGGGVIRSERLILEAPSVVRLGRYVHVPYQRHRSPTRRAVFARDAHQCQYCDQRAETLDHVVPRSRGGEHTWDNVVGACRRCNSKKRDRLLSECGMHLHGRPGPPPPSTWIEVAAGSVPQAWDRFLDSGSRQTA